MKFCPGHNDWTPVEEFYKRSKSKDGLSHVCKNCEKEYHRKHYTKKRTKLIHRKSKLRINYGITIEQFNQMYDEQDGACKICRAKNVKLVVDHDHGTGKVRALLCPGCNHGLGRFGDDPDLLLNAVDYLRHYGYSKTPRDKGQ